MHSVDSEPKPLEVFQSVSRLIVEGRMPGVATRGFGEGPHCVSFFQNSPKVHTCLPDNKICVRDRNFRNHLSLLWANSVPLCIEVLLCSDCPCGIDKCSGSDISLLPDPSWLLLESWTVGSSYKKGGVGAGNGPNGVGTGAGGRDLVGGGSSGRDLLRVIRSHLHFSQLAAWLSLSRGESPKNVLYRVRMPGEEFGTKFRGGTVEHEFPHALVKDQIIKVSVRSLPRSETMPRALCSSPACQPPSPPDEGIGEIIDEITHSHPPLNYNQLGGTISPLIPPPSTAPMSTSSMSSSSLSLTGSSSNSGESYSRGSGERSGRSRKREKRHTTTHARGDRLPSSCTVFGKHYCTEDEDGEEGVEDEDEFLPSKVKIKALSPPLPPPPISSNPGSNVSLKDIFTRSLCTRLQGMELGRRKSGGEIESGGQSGSSEEGDEEEEEEWSESSSSLSSSSSRPIPTLHEKIQFRKSLQSASELVFHGKTGLPLTSSPAPLRRGQNRFDFDSSLVSPAQIHSTLKKSNHHMRSSETSQLLGSFEESVLNGRIEPVSTVEGFSAEIGASGSFCPPHLHLPVTVFFYTFCDNDKVSTPYLAHINVGRRGYALPKKGTLQVTLFNPLRTVIKMFVVLYDLSDMPPNAESFLRQRILYMPLGATGSEGDSQKWLRYLIHLRFASSRSGKIYLHTDIRIVIFRKSDADTAAGHFLVPHELRSFTSFPQNPKYSSKGGSSKKEKEGKTKEKSEKKVKNRKRELETPVQLQKLHLLTT